MYLTLNETILFKMDPHPLELEMSREGNITIELYMSTWDLGAGQDTWEAICSFPKEYG